MSKGMHLRRLPLAREHERIAAMGEQIGGRCA
jgi:hypothetical protein